MKKTKFIHYDIIKITLEMFECRLFDNEGVDYLFAFPVILNDKRRNISLYEVKHIDIKRTPKDILKDEVTVVRHISYK